MDGSMHCEQGLKPGTSHWPGKTNATTQTLVHTLPFKDKDFAP